MEIKKIQDTYAMDISGQSCPGTNEDCCYDCAHWKNNTGSNPNRCTVKLDKENTDLW